MAPRIPQYTQPREAPGLAFPQVVDGGALAAPGLALARLGNTITGVASNLQQEQEQQQRKARGEATWYGNQALIQQGAQDDADWDAIKKANPDPNTWIGEWQKARQPRQQQFLGGFANDPELSKEFTTKVQTADTADMVRRQREVDAENGKYALRIFQTSAATAREQSILRPDQKDNYNIQIDGVVDGLVEAGRITPEQGKQWKQDYRDGVAVDKFTIMAQTEEGRRALPGALGLGSDVTGFADRIAGSESGGNDRARNNVPGSGGTGHFGRLQFSRGRLDEARAAGVMPASMTPEEFLNSPQTQRAVEAWHIQDIDAHIARKGYVAYGYDLNGMRAVAHLGGKGGLDRFIATQGESNPADANGTSLRDYYTRYSNGGGGSGKVDKTFADMSPEARLKLIEKMPGVIEDNRKAQAAQMGATIQQTIADRTVVAQSGGDWSGPEFGPQDYYAAYGPDEGPAKYYEDQRRLGTATAIGNMQGMSATQIADTVAQKQAAIPSGPGAEVAQKTYEAYRDAAQEIIKRRETDPAAEALRNPAIARMYEVAANDPNAVALAVQANLTYQQSLGIAGPKQRPLLNDQAAGIVADFLKPTNDPRQQVRQVVGTVLAFKDPAIQQQVLAQLEEKGLPTGVKFAVRAAAEGRMADAEALGQAAMYASEKPLSTGTVKSAEFTTMVGNAMMSPGDTSANGGTFDAVYFGTDTGSPQAIKAREDAQALVDKLARVYLTTGQSADHNDAINRAIKNLYGNVQAYNGGPGIVLGRNNANVKVMLPAGENGAAYQSGFNRVMETTVKPAVAALVDRLAKQASETLPPEQAAVFQNTLRTQAEAVLNMGGFRNFDTQSFGFFDPYSGTWLAGPDGKPLVFSKDQVLSAAPSQAVPAPVRQPATLRVEQTGGRAPSVPAAPAPVVEVQPPARAGVFDLMDEAVNAARGGPPVPTVNTPTGQRPAGTESPRTRRIEKPRTGRF